MRASPYAAALVCGTTLTLACVACESGSARRAAIVSAMVDADATLIRSRPELAAGKYARMAASPYEYYRGSMPVFAADFRDPSVGIGVSAFAVGGALPFSTGDQHPENFGLLLAADETLSLEPNDLDAADRYPYHWDLRRLSVGLVLLSRLSNPDDEEARAVAAAAAPQVVEAAIRGYRDALTAYAAGAPPERISDAEGVPALADLFRRGERDRLRRAELELTTVDDAGRRVLRRGILVASDPDEVFQDLPASALAELPAALERYRAALAEPPAPDYFTVLDAVRHLGSGVASWPRVRVVILVRGETDDPEDDVLLELKEEGESGAGGWLPPHVFADDPSGRIREATRYAWCRPGIERLWGSTDWLGIPVQIRLESEAHKTLRLDRQEGELGTPEALASLASVLGSLLARVHAAPAPGTEGVAGRIAEAIARDGFVSSEVELALDYAGRVESDWLLFVEALAQRGPILGVQVAPSDRPRADARALFSWPRVDE